MNDLPTAEFFRALGEYVYAYVDDDGNPLYYGKGKDDRCLHHLDEKGFEYEHCYIIARNLEKFADKPSFLLESFMISTYNPIHNSVSGHYKECFVMAGLSSYFKDFKDSQYDAFESFPEWYTSNYSKLKNRMREIKISASSFFIYSSARKGVCIFFSLPHEENGETISVCFDFNANLKDQKLEDVKAGINKWLNDNGYECEPVGKTDYKFATSVSSIQEALDLFDKFWS